MTTVGDVLMVFGGVAGFAVGAWCLVLALNMLFPVMCKRSADLVERKGASQLLVGVLVGGPVILFSVALVGNPVPVLKLVGLAGFVALLTVSAVGFAGLANLTGSRVERSAGATTTYQGLTKGTALLVGACAIPVLGWFVLAPVCMLLNFGSGLGALRGPAAAKASVGETTH